MWTEGEQDFIRVDWYPGMIFAPVDRQFHQHFTTSKTPSRYLALIGGGNARYPLTQKKRDYSTAKDGGQGTIAKSTREGGSQVEYEDQDPRIHEIWLEEMRKNDIERSSRSSAVRNRSRPSPLARTPYPAIMSFASNFAGIACT